MNNKKNTSGGNALDWKERKNRKKNTEEGTVQRGSRYHMCGSLGLRTSNPDGYPCFKKGTPVRALLGKQSVEKKGH